MTRILLPFLFSASVALAATATPHVKLDMTLFMNGKTVRPLIILPYGQAGTISQKDDLGEGFEISVTPTEVASKTDAGQGIQLSFIISELKQGRKSIRSTAQVTTHKGQVASITRNQGSESELKLEVTPQDAP